MDGLQIWLINLDRAGDRLVRVDAQLRQLALPYTRFAAVDALTLTAAQQGQLDTAAYQRLHGMTPLAGELGCYLSHVGVMRAFVASPAKFALVLEDDVILKHSLPAVLRGLLAHGAHWDMVKLSAVHSGTPVAVLEVAPGHQLAVMLSRCTGSSAYLINRCAAQAYLRNPGGLLPMRLPYDHVFDQGWRFGLKVRLVTPTPCHHDNQVATTIISPAGVKRKFHWTRRLPAHAWRVRLEVRRFAYGLWHSLRERLGWLLI